MIEFLEQLSDEENQKLINHTLKGVFNIRDTFISADGYKVFIFDYVTADDKKQETVKMNDVTIETGSFKRDLWLKNMYDFMYKKFGNAWALKAIQYPYYENLRCFTSNKTYQYLMYLKYHLDQQNTSSQIL